MQATEIRYISTLPPIFCGSIEAPHAHSELFLLCGSEVKHTCQVPGSCASAAKEDSPRHSLM